MEHPLFSDCEESPRPRGPRRAAPARRPAVRWEAGRGESPVSLAARARQGSAAALQALAQRCQRGPVQGRAAALRLLPGLVPFQPVWPIIDQIDRPSAPAALRRIIADIRPLIDDPRECEATYRTVQRAVVHGFVTAEQERLPGGR